MCQKQLSVTLISKEQDGIFSCCFLFQDNSVYCGVTYVSESSAGLCRVPKGNTLVTNCFTLFVMCRKYNGILEQMEMYDYVNLYPSVAQQPLSNGDKAIMPLDAIFFLFSRNHWQCCLVIYAGELLLNTSGCASACLSCTVFPVSQLTELGGHEGFCSALCLINENKFTQTGVQIISLLSRQCD